MNCLTNVFRELSHQVSYKFHLLEQETNNDESGVVAELLHNQVGSIVLGPADF
jgi:hypothetical protein